MEKKNLLGGGIGCGRNESHVEKTRKEALDEAQTHSLQKINNQNNTRPHVHSAPTQHCLSATYEYVNKLDIDS